MLNPDGRTFDASSPIGMALLLANELHKAGRISIAECHLFEQVLRPIAFEEWRVFCENARARREARDARETPKEVA